MYFDERGSETVVQGPQSDGVSGIPLTVGLTGGGYVVLWQTSDTAPPGDVYARIYNASGSPQGAAFKILDDYLNFGFPRNVDAVALPDGGFAVTSVKVTAIDALYQPKTSDIVLQLFSATGSATTSSVITTDPLLVPTYLTEPSLAVVGNQLVVSWISGRDVFAERFNLNGQPADSGPYPQILVALGTSNPEEPFPAHINHFSPAATSAGNGSFLITYREGTASDTGDIGYKIFSAGNANRTFDIAHPGVQAMPHSATLDNGNIILTWADYTQTFDNSVVNIRGQILASDGTPIGSELLLAKTNVLVYDQVGNIDGTTLQDYGLTALSGGGFAIVWSNNNTVGPVTVREFNSSGVALRDATAVSNNPGFLPHIAALAGGGYEVVWSSSQTQSVYAQTIADLRTYFTQPGAPVLADFNPAKGWASQDSTPRHVADVNGDGFADIAGFGSDGLYVAFGAANGTFANPVRVLGNFGQTSGWTSDNLYHRVLADVNGDGRADVIGFGQAGTLVSLAGTDGTFGAVIAGTNDFGRAQGWSSQNGFARLVGDVNGDGKADIVGFGAAGTLVALGNGDGTFKEANFGIANFGVAQGWTSDGQFHREIADVNRDGKLDIVGFGAAGTYLALGSGDGSFAAAKLAFNDFGTSQGWTSNDGYSRMVVDVDGDGTVDIVGFGTSGVLVAFGNGDGTFQPVRQDIADFGRAQGYTSDNLTHREFADVNHDGFLDVVGFVSGGVVVGENHGYTLF